MKLSKQHLKPVPGTISDLVELSTRAWGGFVLSTSFDELFIVATGVYLIVTSVIMVTRFVFKSHIK